MVFLEPHQQYIISRTKIQNSANERAGTPKTLRRFDSLAYKMDIPAQAFPARQQL